MTTVLTRPDVEAERGGHPTRWLAVLGLVLSSIGVGVLLLGPGLVAPPGWSTSPKVAAPSAPLTAYVVEPRVTFVGEDATAADGPRPGPHPAAGVPTVVVIPRLDISAPVVSIGVSAGVLLPPGDPQTLGWWDEGARPGAVHGGALITGHTVSTGGGALDHLEALHRGDVVRVRTLSGVLTYQVSGVTIYRKSTLANDAGRVFSQRVPGRLVLITCEDWNGHSYDSNVVVLADPV